MGHASMTFEHLNKPSLVFIMWNFLYILLFILNTLVFVSGSYPCLCAYQIETSVFTSQSNGSSVLGYLNEFDCKPTFPLDDIRNSDFIAVQFQGQIGYTINKPGVLAIESCPGNISSIDKVLATTPRSSTLQTVKTTTPKPTTTPTTTPKPTTTSTITQNPTITPTTTPKPTTTPTTTHKPTTMPTTTPKPTTMPTTTPKPTIMPTTTPKPTTTPTTTPKPTNTPTTTLRPMSTTTPPPTTTVSKSELTCANGWVLYGLKCYTFHFDHKHSHSSASNMCQHDDSQLLNINSREEQNMIASHLRLLNAHNSTVWTGGIWQNGAWVWPNEQSDPNNSDYVNWNTEFPHYQPSHGLCVGVMGSQNFTWRDFHCSDKYNYICEKWANNQTTSANPPIVSTVPSTNIPPTANSTSTPRITKSTTLTTTNTPMPTERCPEHWLKYRSSCYLVTLDDHLSHSKAESQCNKQNSHLVYIESEGEQRVLEGFLHGYHQYELNSQGSHAHESAVWTGGSVDGSHDWVWGHTPISYTNWEPGQPEQKDSRCVAIIGHYDSRWKEYSCHDHFNYICERSVFSTPALVG